MHAPTSSTNAPASTSNTAALSERYLSVGEVAERLGTTVRFPRRLIEERRIEFVRIGRHVRISESVLAEYLASCTVQPTRPAAHLRSVAS